VLLDVDEEIFEADDHYPVVTLLAMLAEQRHDWHPTLPQAMRADEFVDKLTAAQIRMPILVEWVRQAVVEAGNPPPVDKRRIVAVSVVELKRIVADLAKPAVLLVENEIGDGDFVRAVAVALGDHQIVEALDRDPRWLTIYNGGGTGQMPRLAGLRRAEFSVIVRVAVLYDSDRSRPGPSQHDGKVKDTHAAGVAHVHMWAWRMMENYVPLRVWDELFPAKTATRQAVRAMIPAQRGYQHLKKEFVGEKGRMPSPIFRPGVILTEEDFRELGPAVVDELRRLFAMIHEIL
jgi:hypothetical protein